MLPHSRLLTWSSICCLLLSAPLPVQILISMAFAHQYGSWPNVLKSVSLAPSLLSLQPPFWALKQSCILHNPLKFPSLLGFNESCRGFCLCPNITKQGYMVGFYKAVKLAWRRLSWSWLVKKRFWSWITLQTCITHVQKTTSQPRQTPVSQEAVPSTHFIYINIFTCVGFWHCLRVWSMVNSDYKCFVKKKTKGAMWHTVSVFMLTAHMADFKNNYNLSLMCTYSSGKKL